MSTIAKILLITKDKKLVSRITGFLSHSNCQVISALSGKEGLSLAVSSSPDLILLSLDLKDINGHAVLRQLRNTTVSPVIVISRPAGESETVLALALGADDYITMPFQARELITRIHTSLYRSALRIPAPIYKAKQLVIEFDKRSVRLDGRFVHLTQTEYRLLALLAEKAGHVLTYEDILTSIWGPYAANNNQILRVNMANIRHKIEPTPASPQYVFTESGIGYRMRENEYGLNFRNRFALEQKNSRISPAIL